MNARAGLVLALCSACLVRCHWVASAEEKIGATLFVATNGNDAWSGTLAAPNAKRTDGPFASLTRARDAIRQLKAAGPLKTPVQVLVRGGTYYLKEPLQLGPEDSGTKEYPITFGAYRDEKPMVSGGRVLSGWRPYRGRVWSCSLKALGLEALRFRQLFYRGERQVLARWPNRDPKRPRTGGFLHCEGGGGVELRFQAGAFPRQWTLLKEVEVNLFPAYNWTNAIVPLAGRDDDRRVLTLSRSVGEIFVGNRFYVQNALEELDAPGEWYLDSRAETAYFWPPDEGLAKEGTLVAALQNLMAFEGDPDRSKQFVEHVRLSHLGLECCEKDAVVLQAARHCGVIGCTLTKVGGAGVVIGAGSRFCRVAGNDIAFPGGHAVAMYYDVASPKAPTDNTITNNYAHHCGEILKCSFGWGSGLCISGHRNVVSHNLVHDTAYNPMNFDGWDHVIEYNVFHHGNLELCDCGGIYGWVNTKGGSGRNIIRFNRIYDTIGYGMPSPGQWQSPYFSWGIYLDDYLSETTVYGNLVYRAYRGCLHLHGGWNNTVENNVFADGELSQVTLSNMSRDKPSLSGLTGKESPGPGKWSMSGIVLRRNILYYSQPDSRAYQGSNFEDCTLKEADWNLLWHRGLPIQIGLKGMAPEDSWRLWRADGRDVHSVVTDPLFVNPDKDDFRLRPDSPALKLGFTPLPIEQMGPVRSPERASWPVVEPQVYRDPPARPLPPPPAGTPIARAYRAVGPIHIDGKVDPEEWGPPTLVVERLSNVGEVSEQKGTAYVVCDKSNLYVALLSPLTATSKKVEVEVFFQVATESGPGEAFVLRGDSSGKWETSTAPVASMQHTKRVGQAVKYAAASEKGQCCMEWQIPVAAWDLSLKATGKLRLNLRVRQGPANPWVGWAAAGDPAARPEAMGYLVFDPPVRAGDRNLLANGAFEVGTDKPEGWSVNERTTGELPPGARKSACSWVGEGRDGSRCLKLQALDAAAMAVSEHWWAHTIKAPAAGAYVMTYEMRAQDLRSRGEGGRFYACGWAQRKKGSSPEGMNLGWTPENHLEHGSVLWWTRRECVLEVPADVEMLYLLFGIERATGTVWIDNVRLERCE